MPQFFQDNIPLLQRDTGTQISMPATYNGQLARARVAGQGYRWSSALACNLATTGLGGLDTGSLAANTLYHVYLCVSSNIVGLVVSANGPSTGPTGFSQNRYVGRLRTQSGSANVAELAVVNVIVGSGDEIPMPIVGEWQSFTPTGSWSTNVNYSGWYRRTGSSMDWRGKVAATATLSGTTQLTMTLPLNLTVTSSGLTTNGRSFLGKALVTTSGSTRRVLAFCYGNNGSNNITFEYHSQNANTDTTLNTVVDVSQTTPFTMNNGDFVEGYIEGLPIAEWQGLFS